MCVTCPFAETVLVQAPAGDVGTGGAGFWERMLRLAWNYVLLSPCMKRASHLDRAGRPDVERAGRDAHASRARLGGGPRAGSLGEAPSSSSGTRRGHLGPNEFKPRQKRREKRVFHLLWILC